MSISRKLVLSGLVAALCVGGLVSCGSGTNNDQGTSFAALGFFQDGNGETGDVGRDVSINVDAFGTTSTEGFAYPLAMATFIGLESRLTKQFIRVNRVDCSYDVAGADPSLIIPDDSVAVSATLPATEDADGNITESNTFLQFTIVTPDLLSFLNVNRNLLPTLPFRMIASCFATGVTQAGDTMQTNVIFYEIVFKEDPECCAGSGAGGGPGFQQGPGTGGDIGSASGASSSSSAASVL